MRGSEEVRSRGTQANLTTRNGQTPRGGDGRSEISDSQRCGLVVSLVPDDPVALLGCQVSEPVVFGAPWRLRGVVLTPASFVVLDEVVSEVPVPLVPVVPPALDVPVLPVVSVVPVPVVPVPVVPVVPVPVVPLGYRV